MTDEDRRPHRRLVPRAATALALGLLLVGVVAAPAKAATPRPRRRSGPANSELVGIVPLPTRGSCPGSRPGSGVPSLLSDRVAVFVAQQRSAFDSLAEGRQPAGAARLTLAGRVREDSLLRRRLAETFRPELASAGSEAAGVLDALEAATSWRSWDHLRRDLGRSPDRAARAMELLVRGILCGTPHVKARA